MSGIVLALGMGGVAACVLADPPAALPVSPIEGPEIDHESVVPQSPFLIAWPQQFVVPVSADPRETNIQWVFQIDQGTTQPTLQGSLGIQPDAGGLISITDTQAPSLAMCHTIELRVSYSDLPGGDSVFWYYSPTESFLGCPVFDAGPGDSGPPDGGDEGG